MCLTTHVLAVKRNADSEICDSAVYNRDFADL